MLIGEGVCRLLLNPLDILSPELVHDDILGHHIKPYSGGHDAWGFRNFEVPDSAEIVVIGDSQTWGINAKTKDSFPYQLSELTNKTVYNFGISGYGPVQYHVILKSFALKLKPSTVIVAIYLGNDFDDAFKLVYKKEHWKHLRKREFPGEYQNSFNEQPGDYALGLRYWLNHHSVFYRFSKSRLEFITEFNKDLDKRNIKYHINVSNIERYFNPEVRLSVMNFNDPKIKEGLRLTLDCLADMKSQCVFNGSELLIALIPSDVMVYSDILAHGDLITREIFDSIVFSENKLKDILIEEFNKKNVRYIDVLDSLKASIAEPIYPVWDDHPTAVGYRKIAQAIAAQIK